MSKDAEDDEHLERDESADSEEATSDEGSSSEPSGDEAEAVTAPRASVEPDSGKKRKKKKHKSAAASSGASVKKQKKGASGVREAAPERREPVKAPSAPEDTPWGLVAIAVGIACAAVFGLYAWKHQGPSEDDLETAVDIAPTAQPPAAPSNDPFAAPPDVARPPANAQRTPSGLASRVLRPGTGTEHPGPTSRVTVHYTGWTTDGNMFDSSRRRGQPATFPLNGVIAGWTEGLQLMVPGEQRRFWIPEQLAYQGRPGRPQGMLVFDVELISIQH